VDGQACQWKERQEERKKEAGGPSGVLFGENALHNLRLDFTTPFDKKAPVAV
jgi:hypothetical protein